jgi:nitrite reductase (NADH) large subunit
MKYLIIGNGAAGIAAAEAIRKNDSTGAVTILNSERYYHYSRPRVIEFLSGKTSLEQITIKNSEFYEKNNIRLVMLVNVTKIDAAKKSVSLEGGIEENYDKLIIAAGANSFLPPVTGSDNEGVFTLRTIDDAKAIIDYAKGKNEAVVIGGGLLGIEAAVSLTALGLRVTIVEVFDRLLPRQLDTQSAAILQGLLEQKKLSFMLPKQTRLISRDENGKLKISFGDNTAAAADLVLFSAGIRCNLKIIEGSGIQAGKGIKVNDLMETSAVDVYAAGDIAEHNGTVYGLWPMSREQGAAAGANASGGKTEYKGTLLSARLKVAGIDLCSIGAVEAGEGIKTVTKQGPGNIRKLFIKDNKITGAILIGDISKFQEIQELIKKGAAIGDPEAVI